MKAKWGLFMTRQKKNTIITSGIAVLAVIVGRDALIYVPNPDEKEFAEFLSNAKEKSTFSSEVEITENDTLITLSTCSYEYNHARYIVIGKLNRL